MSEQGSARKPAGDAVRLAAIGCFALVVALAGVFTLPPLDRDEARFAEATAEMLETGDFVSIRFQGAERNKKPAGIHWLQAASVEAFSDPQARAIWAYRIPSVIGAVLASIFTYLIGARLFSRETGTTAALLLAAAPVIAGEATIAKTDAMLLATITGAQAAFVAILIAARAGRTAPRAALAFWLAIGAGVLIKGPIIVMVVGLTAAAFAAFEKDVRPWRAMRPLAGGLILILMITPWALAVQTATDGRFFAQAVGGDMLAKIGAGKESHGAPPGYHLLLLPILLWPSAALLPAAFARAFHERADWRIKLLICWIVPSWIVFEAAATKLPHYTLPLYPAIAILAAYAATGPARAALRYSGAALYAAIAALFAAAIIAAPQIFDEPQLRAYALTAAFGVAAVALGAALLFARGRNKEGVALASLAAAGAAWALLGGILPNLGALNVSGRINAAIAAESLHPLRNGADPAVLSGYYEPSVIFLLGAKSFLGDGASAAEHFNKGGGAAAIEAAEQPAFERRLADLGGGAQPFGVVDGFNYSNGKPVTITLYRPLAARDEAQ